MFQNAQPLSAETHRNLRFRNLPDYSFARDLLYAPITYTEMLEASKVYPVVFPKEGMPVALLGAEGDEFVDDNGQWTVPYMPAHVAHAFILGHTEREGEMVVMVDVDAPHFQTDEGERLFEEDGTPTQVVRAGQDLSGRLSGRIENVSATDRAPTEEAGILEERALQRKKGGEQRTVLRRFYVVNQEKFDALPDETILAWRRDGTLRLVYAHLMSLSNLRQLKG